MRATSTRKKNPLQKNSRHTSIHSSRSRLRPNDLFSKQFFIDTFASHPIRQLIAAAVVILVCLYIALIAAVGQEEKTDDTLLLSNLSLEQVFTQKTMRSVRTRMELEEDAILYLYEPPTVITDETGTITAFSLPLATANEDRYHLWTMQYRPETQSLHLAQTQKNLSVKDLAVPLDELPTEEIIRTFLQFPGKYLTQIIPVAQGTSYTFTPASSPAVLDYDFSSEVAAGTIGLWISRSGGGSVIDATFYPTGDYLTYYCTCTDQTGVQQKLLVMTEIQQL